MALTRDDIGSLFPDIDMNRVSFLSLLDDFFEGVLVTDNRGYVLFMNEEQARIDDLPARSLVGKKVTDIYHVDDGDSPVIQCLASGKAIKGVACYYRTWTGKIVNSIHNVFPLFDDRKLLGAICFIQDFSIIEQRFESVFQPEKIKNLQTGTSKAGRQKGRPHKNGTRFRFEDIIGTSRELMDSVDMGRLAAQSASPVMIYGETGTGKELLAQSIHNAGPRQSENYVAVNCAAIPENLLEGIMFGTSAGAFTGAVDKPGLFEKADGGTLFLDEVTELPVGVQAKLLRVLQDGAYERLGGTQTLTSDTRLIAATNRDVRAAVNEGVLREDLYYRLNVIQLHVPPLRERIEDIPLLARHFVDRFAAQHGRAVRGLSEGVVQALESYPWPGNVRELENALERAVVLSRSEQLELSTLPPDIARARRAPERLSFSVGTPLKIMERRMIEATMKKCGGDKVQTAQMLGTTVRTIYRREAEWRRDR